MTGGDGPYHTETTYAYAALEFAGGNYGGECHPLYLQLIEPMEDVAWNCGTVYTDGQTFVRKISNFILNNPQEITSATDWQELGDGENILIAVTCRLLERSGGRSRQRRSSAA